MSFEVEQHWNETFPCITKPEVVGYFSINGQREYLPDLSQLKYFNAPRNSRGEGVELNLNHGIDKVIRKPESASGEKINHLLHWIIYNSSQIEAPPGYGRWLKPEFVCYRGLLSALWRTPFEESDGWIVCAVKFKGTIYLCGFDTEEMKQRKENATARDLMMSSWGFKFEQYVLSDSPEKKPDVSEPVNESEEFCCMFSCEFGDNSMLYGAEMDGIETTEPLKEPVPWKNVNFIELKTNRIIETGRQDVFFRKKLLRWWCQSFLVGIENILCGFRTNNGKVIDLKRYKVVDLIKMAKNYWEPSPCMNFCDAFLSHIKTVVTEDYNKCIYKFTWRPGGKIEMNILNSEVASGLGAQYAFLPQWFTERAAELQRN
ncbi:decapping and exoribonuclease protein-like [Belonocnema kinseyi]|uniref:decapping and exoribonuclease protein-like n=1 Tax=Belonocnema kinseyi TaxID=2817044 RepID=UPI00143DE329|nr:decapping and exoribonuclease protein-like [Belonocnema kinseyi]